MPNIGMSDDGSEPDVYFDCDVCSGERGRERRSEGSSICAHESCKCELKRRRAVGEAVGTTPAAKKPAAGGKRCTCQVIREVLGVDMAVAASERDMRAGGLADDAKIAYKVRGGWGEDAADEFIPGTRWVNLTELVANIDEKGCAALDSWAGELKKAAAAARKRLRRRTSPAK